MEHSTRPVSMTSNLLVPFYRGPAVVVHDERVSFDLQIGTAWGSG
jgi:hypothetical protein